MLKGNNFPLKHEVQKNSVCSRYDVIVKKRCVVYLCVGKIANDTTQETDRDGWKSTRLNMNTKRPFALSAQRQYLTWYVLWMPYRIWCETCDYIFIHFYYYKTNIYNVGFYAQTTIPFGLHQREFIVYMLFISFTYDVSSLFTEQRPIFPAYR